MALDGDACYRAFRARDGRFDGVFYVGVRTTGIYCRPICPARTPGRDRCRFFVRAAEAEREGYRPCLRCRPELAPGSARVDSIPRLVHTAAARIEAGFLNEHSIAELAESVKVSSRHLRRAMESELGVSPVELAQTRRLALARQLLQDTALPVATVAHAAGFGSVRRLNALFRSRLGRPPSSLRRSHAGRDDECIELSLGVRPPFDGVALLRFLSQRAIPGVESVCDGEYRRAVDLGPEDGWLSVRVVEAGRVVRARVSLTLAPRLPAIVARLRCLFDLDARPDVIDGHLGQQPVLRRSVSAHPGLRVPGAFDGFEVAVRAILGQQVTVKAATTLAGRLVERFGRPVAHAPPGLTHRFPSAERLARASGVSVARVGLPRRRAETIVALSQALVDGRVELSPAADVERTLTGLLALPGIGPWSAHYMAMRCLDWPNAFLAGDLWVRRLLKVDRAREAETRAQAWAPWRAYGVMHLWSEGSEGIEGRSSRRTSSTNR